jgi:hypothetical protein
MKPLIIGFLVLLTSGHLCYPQGQSLADYNRTVEAKLTDNKNLTPKEFRNLRIRLGVEMASADDSFYKTGELLRLLEYSTMWAYLTQDHSIEKFVKEMWLKFLNLPNPAKKMPDATYYQAVLEARKSDPYEILKFSQYVKKLLENENGKSFLYPLVKAGCDVLRIARKTAEFETCWAEQVSLADFPGAKLESFGEKITYDLEVKGRLDDFKIQADKILQDDSLEPLREIVQWQSLLIRALTENPGKLLDEADKLKRSTKNTELADRAILILHLSAGHLEKALQGFNSISEADLTPQYRSEYNKLGAEIYFKRKELKKTEHFINKALKSEENDFNRLEDYMGLMLLSLSKKTAVDLLLAKEALEKVQKKIELYKIEDPTYLSIAKLSQFLIDNQNPPVAELGKIVEEYKASQLPLEFYYQLADQSFLQYKDNANKIH